MDTVDIALQAKHHHAELSSLLQKILALSNLSPSPSPKTKTNVKFTPSTKSSPLPSPPMTNDFTSLENQKKEMEEFKKNLARLTKPGSFPLYLDKAPAPKQDPSQKGTKYIPPAKRTTSIRNYESLEALQTMDITKLLDLGETTPMTDPSEVTRIHSARNRINKQFQEFWKRHYGWDFHFNVCLRDMNYMTLTEVAITRNHYITQILGGTCEKVLDVFTGKGSDFFSWAMTPGVKQLYGMTISVDRNVFYRNIFEFQKGFVKQYGENNPNHPLPIMIVEENDASVTSYDQVKFVYPKLPKVIDVLYMDPPWTLTEKMYEAGPYDYQSKDPKIKQQRRQRESSSYEIVEFLEKRVFKPLRDNGTTFRCMVIKGNWKQEVMEELASHFPGFELKARIDAAPTKNTFQTYIFTHEDIEVLQYEPGEDHLQVYPTSYNKMLVSHSKEGNVHVTHIIPHKDGKKARDNKT